MSNLMGQLIFYFFGMGVGYFFFFKKLRKLKEKSKEVEETFTKAVSALTSAVNLFAILLKSKKEYNVKDGDGNNWEIKVDKKKKE